MSNQPGANLAHMATIEIELPDGTAEAYLARPGDDGEHPGVLFFIDAIGLRPRIEEMADRIAGWGYVVLAPNLFFRTGTADELAPKSDLREQGAREEFFATVAPRMQEITAARMDADTTVFLDALQAQPGVVAPGPVGVTGYCMGARYATRAAGTNADRVAAVGGFHGGRLVTDAADSPHLQLANARAQFVYGHADNDASMPPEAVEALGAELAAQGLVATNAIYPGAAHGYTMADTSTYDETGSERHFTELKALLDRTLA